MKKGLIRTFSLLLLCAIMFSLAAFGSAAENTMEIDVESINVSNTSHQFDEIYPGDMLEAKAVVNTQEASSIILLAGIYSNESLVAVKYEAFSNVTGKATLKLSGIEIPKNLTGNSILKILLWDEINNMRPIYKVTEIPICSDSMRVVVGDDVLFGVNKSNGEQVTSKVWATGRVYLQDDTGDQRNPVPVVPGKESDKYVYMKFDVSQFTEAMLDNKEVEFDFSLTRYLWQVQTYADIYCLLDADWNENNITGANRSAFKESDKIISDFALPSGAISWCRFDVTQTVKKAVTDGAKTITLIACSDSPRMQFDDKTSKVYVPMLKVRPKKPDTDISEVAVNGKTYEVEPGKTNYGILLDQNLRIDTLTVKPLDSRAQVMNLSLPSSLPGEATFQVRSRDGKIADYILYLGETPKISEGHPRCFITKDYLPILQKRIYNNPDAIVKSAWETCKYHAGLQYDGVLSARGDSYYNAYELHVRTARSAALTYLLTEDVAYGQKAVSIIMNVLDTFEFDPDYLDISRQIGEVIYNSALVYDWCYPLISQQQKSEFTSKVTMLISKLETGYPPKRNMMTVVSGHGSEKMFLRDTLTAAVSMYDEKPEIYENCISYFLKDYVPVRNYWAPSGWFHQGNNYNFRLGSDLYSALLFSRLGYDNIYIKDLKNTFLQPLLYMRQPDGKLFTDGDDHPQKFGDYFISVSEMPFLFSAYTKSPYVNFELGKQRYTKADPVMALMFYTPETGSNNPNTLPLTRYFGEPYGAMIARTGWELGANSPDAMAMMKISTRNYGGHQHMDAGQFQLYYKGSLALDTGKYKYGDGHYENYFIRTVAHNSLLIYDPNERFTWNGKEISNDGGQKVDLPGAKFRLIPFDLNELQSPVFKKGEVLAHGFGPDTQSPDYSYLEGDITDAYSSDKAANVNRSFVFLNLANEEVPAALVVFDRITSKKPEFIKKWLLHVPAAPEISDNTIWASRKTEGANGKIVNTVLLPKQNNLAIHVEGGVNREFMVDGKSYPPDYSGEYPESWDVKSHRVEVSPRNTAETDYFLNAMQVMDADGNAVPFEPKLIESEQFAGTVIKNRVVIFSKSKERTADTVSVTIPSGQFSYKVLITGLKTGNWMVKGGEESFICASDSESGSVYFEGTSGNYTLTYAPDLLGAIAVAENEAKNVPVIGMKLKINGIYCYTRKPIELINGVYMLPLADVFNGIRQIAYQTNVNFTLSEDNRTGSGSFGTKTFGIEEGNATVTIGTETVLLGIKPILKNGTLYAPVEFFNTLIGNLKLNRVFSPSAFLELDVL